MAIDGPRLFQGDPDSDTASNITYRLGRITKCIVSKDQDIWEDPKLAWLLYFNMGDSVESDPDMDAATVCQHIDSGAGDQLFQEYRAEEDNRKHYGAYSRHETIVLGAMMMRVGAKIKKEDLAHLRRLSVRSDNVMGPEEVAEFQAAIDNYQAGTPRTFGGPSCDTCGKTTLDTDGKKLSECKRCMSGYWTGGWSCSKVRGSISPYFGQLPLTFFFCHRPASRLTGTCTSGRLGPTTSTSRNRKPRKPGRRRGRRQERSRKQAREATERCSRTLLEGEVFRRLTIGVDLILVFFVIVVVVRATMYRSTD
ncbi:hypothetical protein B0T16DRAFT_145812 [Cercophora newfieldiana]|uniref:Uncharacterized protein n=1 Tax=Cercophora newfieldiana TaxID=92897 RepID=A0AA39Y637_9PEZI|nr:hypothetical protein B0T16DRAFT_145812 [Cercophora newfieldiana]